MRFFIPTILSALLVSAQGTAAESHGDVVHLLKRVARERRVCAQKISSEEMALLSASDQLARSQRVRLISKGLLNTSIVLLTAASGGGVLLATNLEFWPAAVFF